MFYHALVAVTGRHSCAARSFAITRLAGEHLQGLRNSLNGNNLLYLPWPRKATFRCAWRHFVMTHADRTPDPETREAVDRDLTMDIREIRKRS
jgi:hypothetical protein